MNYAISTAISGPPERAWAALVDLAAWPRWNRLVPHGEGTLREGETLTFRIRGVPRPHRAVVVRLREPDEIVLAATFVHRWLLRMEHTFAFDGGRLHQRWEVTGLLAPLLWRRLVPTMARFAEFGEDLSAAAAVADQYVVDAVDGAAEATSPARASGLHRRPPPPRSRE